VARVEVENGHDELASSCRAIRDLLRSTLLSDFANYPLSYCAMEARAQSLEEQLTTRKVVERAKGLIIEQYSVTEQQAYNLLSSWSMATRKPLRAVAEVVLEMDQIARLIKVLK
jgi:AmiR/NasT family two-component response regulator